MTMKKVLFTLVLVFVAVSASAQMIARVSDLKMKSKFFDHERQIMIYTPVGYDEFDAVEYDVMYVFDSQERSKFDMVHCAIDFNQSNDPDLMKEFIIVGVCSPNYPEINYFRNTDYLPMPKVEIGKGHFANEGGYGRSGDLKRFLKQELMPYIDSHYRTTGRNIGIGHSLSASFVLDCMVTDELFDDYIAISPNYSYDGFRVANDIEQYPFKNLKKPRFIYTSMASEKTVFGEKWEQGWKRASTFFSDKSHFNPTTIVSVHNYPEYGHNPSYLPSLAQAMKEYLGYAISMLPQCTSSETYPIHIELQGKHANGDVYITGNQDALANWNPKGIKMKHVNDTTVAVDLQLHLPAYFKFTKGDWDHQAFMENAPEGNLIIANPKTKKRVYHLVDDYSWIKY